MIRINVPWLFEVITGIDGLDSLKSDQTVVDNLTELYAAQQQLQMVFASSFYGDYLRTSRSLASDLYNVLTKQVESDWQTKISEFEIQNIKITKERFRTVFIAELSTLPVYLVSKKDNFDVNLLIETGIKLFPSPMAAKVPETALDAQEVGRALAFELPTACGFHAFRVVESVVRRYWDQVSSQKPRPKLETLGNFAVEMEKENFGDAKVIEAIKQMTKLHRNPLIHPEVILETEEAIGIIGMARSVISMMLQSLPEIPVTTASQPTTSAPSSVP